MERTGWVCRVDMVWRGPGGYVGWTLVDMVWRGPGGYVGWTLCGEDRVGGWTLCGEDRV